MPNVITLAARGYRFIDAVFQYSGGVAAEPGYRIQRVRLARPAPLADGFRLIAEILRGEGLPLTAFCACELRSPAPFDDQGFFDFNTRYAAVLKEWGVLADGKNPVARSNVCPEITPPAEPSFHAFSYCVPAAGTAPSFVIAGSGESIEGGATYRERTVAYQDISEQGMRRKAEHVMAQMDARMSALGCAWPQTTATQIYTVHNLYPFMPDLLIHGGAASGDMTWHYARPPVIDLEFEMDCRGVASERVI